MAPILKRWVSLLHKMIQAHPPSVTSPSPNEWPQNLIKTITGITRDSQAQITCPSHGLDSTSNGSTFVDFKQVRGMIQINGMNAIIQSIVDSNNFIVNIDSTNFYNYTSGGVVIIDSGLPPTTTASFQTFNTPFKNIL